MGTRLGAVVVVGMGVPDAPGVLWTRCTGVIRGAFRGKGVGCSGASS